MALNTGAFLRDSYTQVRTLGDKSISSDAVFVIDGFEQLRMLCKQFPWPLLSPRGEIAIAMPNGGEAWQPQQLETNQQGQCQFYETVEGDMETFIESVTAQGSKFNASVYEGSLESYSRGCRVMDAFFKFDNPDRDWENRAQVTTISGTLFFHYFGDKIVGNQT